MKQPEGFVIPGQEKKVYKLIRSLYGLEQALKVLWCESVPNALVGADKPI